MRLLALFLLIATQAFRYAKMLFEGGLTSARVQAARARLREAQARGRQLALDIALEVRQAALDLTEAIAFGNNVELDDTQLSNDNATFDLNGHSDAVGSLTVIVPLYVPADRPLVE
mgnify:CR=1 FL=1